MAESVSAEKKECSMKESAMLELTETMERLEAVAEALEQAAERIAEQQVALAAEAQQSVGRIVATVETAREVELERRLAEAEQKIAELTAAAAPKAAGRVTLPAGMATMLAKQGVTLDAGGSFPSMEASAIDGALASLSIEQRIAVKSELLRAGLLG
jgi:predicted RNase H-like nuclease (RuvC/YqgF family)